MKFAIIRYYLICIFLCVPSFINAQSWVQEIKLADSLYNNNEYREASVLYEYVVYSCNEITIRNNAVFQKALCMKQLKKFDKAYEGLQRIDYNGINDSLLFVYQKESVVSAYLAALYHESLSHIEQLEAIITDTILISSIFKIKALNCNELMQYDNAESSAVQYIKLNSTGSKKDSLLNIAKQLYAKTNLPRLKNVKISNTIGFIPGVGAFYAGYYGEAALNILINCAAFGFGAYEILNKYYITGYVVGFGVFSQFLFGGQTRAVFLVNKRNYKNKKEFNDKVRLFLNSIE